MNRTREGQGIRLRDARLYRRTMHTRFPFRFGKVSLTELPIVYLRLFLESEQGKIVEGVTACALAAQWFDKRPSRSIAQKEADLLNSLSQAIDAYTASGLATAWDLHASTANAVSSHLMDRGMSGLVAGFGAALVDAAIIDGVCRLREQPFFAALREDLGIPVQDAALLPATPLNAIRLRHTIGLADALRASDLATALADGLPETLEEVLSFYQPSFFKIKIGSDAAETLPRLQRIAEILDARAGDYRVTLDGNEQFGDMASFRSFLETLRGQQGMLALLSRTLWIEQPVRRESALDPTSAPDVVAVAGFKPVIIDESDEDDTALDRALALGYSGVSSKLCKGVYRSVAHYLRLRRARDAGTKGLILSSEDLTTVAVHPLQQDLCLAAALDVSHSERNGHHYVRSFAYLSAAEREDALLRYPSLYASDGNDGAKVLAAHGTFNLAEVNSALGFGSSSYPDWSALEPLA